jgi:uncharacterized protein (DUF302 family)
MNTVTPMNTVTAGNTRVIPETVEQSVPMIRRLLRDAGLSVVEEFNLSSDPHFQSGVARRSCIVLLVDTPELLLECIAPDRAAAVFLPVHVVISGDRDTTSVYWAHPPAGAGEPPPAKAPLEELNARVTEALRALLRVNGACERPSD